MRSANEKKMFDLLLDEIEDTLLDIEQRCLKLESSDQAKELQIIFRAAHNVKGAAQLYGLSDFGAFVHTFEDLLTTLQKQNKAVTAASVDMLLGAQGFLRTWVEGLRENDKHMPDMGFKNTIIAHIEDLKAGRVPADAGTKTQKPQPKEEPKPEVKAETKTEAAPAPAPAQASEDDDADGTKELAAAVADALTASPNGGSGGGRRNKRSSGTLRIPSQKIDEIMQLIGELSIHQGILWHNYQQNTFNVLTCKNAVTLNQKTIKDLYDLVLTLRMQSAESLFQRIERTARDIARDQKKKINIQLIGADTPLDKTVIELITDPMMHLVRNAIDHGIEDDETRVKLGKPVPSRITIQTQQDSGHVIISISDDGRGLDPQHILEKATKRGLVQPGTKMKDEEIINLIFLPGFSTRDKVTEISGRGVGMDIVQKAIDSLGGRIETQTRKGAGTTFNITLPASLEIIEGLMVRVTDQILIVPRQDVVEIVDLDAFGLSKIGKGDRAIRIRDQVVPVEDLADYVGAGTDAPKAAEGAPLVNTGKNIGLLIRLPDRTRLALRVEAVLSQQQIVVRPLNDHLAKVPGFTGVTILGNGEPAMILSTAAIAETYMKWIRRTTNEGKKKYGETA